MSRDKKNLSKSKEEVAKRLKQFRKTLGMTQDEFSRVLGVSKPAYVRYESGDRFTPLEMLYILNHLYKVNLNWLVMGNGDMFVTDDSPGLSGNRSLPGIEPEKYESYLNMINLMVDIPVIEQILLAKFTELKTLFKEEIKKVSDPKKK